MDFITYRAFQSLVEGVFTITADLLVISESNYYYLPNYTTNMMTFHSILSTCLSSVASSLHLRMEFSYVIPMFVVTTQSLCMALNFLQLGF